jgi:hypothetical protein
MYKKKWIIVLTVVRFNSQNILLLLPDFQLEEYENILIICTLKVMLNNYLHHLSEYKSASLKYGLNKSCILLPKFKIESVVRTV